MEYKIFVTEEFEKDFKKLDKSIKKNIEKEIEKLKTNPYSGKPLGYKFFREKKIKKYRIYYLIYESYLIIFVIAISDKKEQQDTINKIKKLIPLYKKEIEKIVNSF